MKVFDNGLFDSLTEKQKMGIEAYVTNGFCIQAAAEESGYTVKGLTAWLHTEKARECVRAYTLFLTGNKKDTLEYRLIDTYMTRAFYNPGDIVNQDGHLISDNLKELGKLAICVDGIETEEKGFITITNEDGKKESKPIIKKKVKLADREKSLEQLCKYMKIMTDQIELTGKDGGPLDLYKMTRSERRKKIDELLKKREEKK
jgi:hypothetical protein